MMVKTGSRFIFWFFVLFICISASLPSLVRIYNIRAIFFSKAVQEDALEAMAFLKKEKGFGATDTKLERIVQDDKKNNFYFEYRYHSPRAIFESSEFKVSVEGDNIKIEKL